VRRATLVMLLIAGAAGSAPAGDLAPPGPPAPTMRNLQEVFEQVAQANRAAGGGDALLFYPHIVDQEGTISTTPNSFDTTFYLVATGPYVGTSLKSGAASVPNKSVSDVTVSLYLFDSTGQPALSATAAQVAFPATFTVGYGTPRASAQITNLFLSAGGFPAGIFEGFAVLSVSSGDWNDVAVQGFTLNSHTTAFDLSITALEPVRIQDAPAAVKSDAPEIGEAGQ